MLCIGLGIRVLGHVSVVVVPGWWERYSSELPLGRLVMYTERGVASALLAALG